MEQLLLCFLAKTTYTKACKYDGSVAQRVRDFPKIEFKSFPAVTLRYDFTNLVTYRTGNLNHAYFGVISGKPQNLFSLQC